MLLHDMKIKMTSKHEIFMMVLAEHSTKGIPNPVVEWKPTWQVYSSDELRKCICTHPIKNTYEIINEVNGNTLWIGSDCIKRWMEDRVRCRKCHCQLKNIIAKLDNKILFCNDCSKAVERLGLFKYYHNHRSSDEGYWLHHKLFITLIDNEWFCNYIANLETKTQSQQAFYDYMTLFYDVV
tara:strand:- start:137 stop:679 length:543 start_codon:yes stop_codon:yes gene_type:complete